MSRIALNIDADLLKRLDDRASRQKVSREAVAQKILEAGLAPKKKAAAKKKRS